MSKERLEEIKENVTVDIVDLVYYGYLDGSIEHWVKSYTLSEGDYRYLIKQAERVQELENKYQVRQIEYLEGYIDRLEQQNKRYREAIERARRELETCARSAYLTLSKALVGLK